MYACKVKLYGLENESSHSKYIGPCNCQENESYKGLRLFLESVGYVEWPFKFWNLEESNRISIKLEGLTTIEKCIYVILVCNADGRGSTKQRRIETFNTSRDDKVLPNLTKEC
jgi:hypothetical protein